MFVVNQVPNDSSRPDLQRQTKKLRGLGRITVDEPGVQIEALAELAQNSMDSLGKQYIFHLKSSRKAKSLKPQAGYMFLEWK